MLSVFISYRREDSRAYAGRIFDRLKVRLGGTENVFMDVVAIAPGSDFVVAMDQALRRCNALVVVIGRHWADSVDAEGRLRLANPQDYVRLELATALARGMRVLPILVDGASMPREDLLPSDLKKLARIEALELSDSRWDYDMEQLMQALTGHSQSIPSVGRNLGGGARRDRLEIHRAFHSRKCGLLHADDVDSIGAGVGKAGGGRVCGGATVRTGIRGLHGALGRPAERHVQSEAESIALCQLRAESRLTERW